MTIEFDPAKDESNVLKHGVSLARAANLEILARLRDTRFTTEVRYRAYGLIDGKAYCLAYTIRGQNVRVISLRRARAKEVRQYLPASG